MKAFDELNTIADRLIGPGGCPWDQEQTFHSLRSYILEEVYELFEAIDDDDTVEILQELGDFFFNALFLCKIAEKEKRFTTEDVLHFIKEKLIRRHPHVFADAEINSVDELYKQWETIKSKENSNGKRTSALDGIPKSVPSLFKAQKLLKRLHKHNYCVNSQINDKEEAVGYQLLALIDDAESKGVNAELALNKVLTIQDRQFREWEKQEKEQNS